MIRLISTCKSSKVFSYKKENPLNNFLSSRKIPLHGPGKVCMDWFISQKQHTAKD